MNAATRFALTETTLTVRDLTVHFDTPLGSFHAVDGIDFDLRPGEILGLVGESGSGKSMTLRALTRLVPSPGQVTGSILWRGRELTTLSEAALRSTRGREIAMVFQEPTTALNPVLTVRLQIDENLKAGVLSSFSILSAYPLPRPVSTTIRTSSPAACGSAS